MKALEALAAADAWLSGSKTAPDPVGLAEALSKAGGAAALLETADGSPGLRARAATLLAALRAVERDRKMIDDLDEARLSGANVKDNHFDGEVMREGFLGAMRSYGIDVGVMSAGEAAARIRSSPIRDELILALDEFADVPGTAPDERLAAIATLVDVPENAPLRALIGARMPPA